MKVFISWSGSLSKQVALVFKTWIESVLQNAEVWISDEDIDKGSLWIRDIGDELAKTTVGILCLTPENIAAPWVLFEAGALSKGLSNSRVCPLLVNLTTTDLKPPLSQFNCTLPTKEDMLKLTRTINSQNADKALSEEKLQKAFEKWWKEFESRFADILNGYRPAIVENRRTVPDMVEEILEITRSIQKKLQQDVSTGAQGVFGSTGPASDYGDYLRKIGMHPMKPTDDPWNHFRESNMPTGSRAESVKNPLSLEGHGQEVSIALQEKKIGS